MPSKSIVFIHGMFVTRACWDDWIRYCQTKGYTAVAPGWPGRDITVEEMRNRHPDAKLADLALPAIVQHYERIVRQQPDPPILIGHSMGGLIVQLLLQKGLGAAGIAINSAPPQGIITLQPSFLTSNWPALNPFAGSKPFMMTYKQFQSTFAHTMAPDQAQAAYEKHVVPESRLVARAALTADARVDFAKQRAPLLLIAGEEDQIIPLDLNKNNYNAYIRQEKTSKSITRFREFARRTHYIIGQENWEQVAEYSLDWARSMA